MIHEFKGLDMWGFGIRVKWGPLLGDGRPAKELLPKVNLGSQTIPNP